MPISILHSSYSVQQAVQETSSHDNPNNAVSQRSNQVPIRDILAQFRARADYLDSEFFRLQEYVRGEERITPNTLNWENRLITENARFSYEKSRINALAERLEAHEIHIPPNEELNNLWHEQRGERAQNLTAAQVRLIRTIRTQGYTFLNTNSNGEQINMNVRHISEEIEFDLWIAEALIALSHDQNPDEMEPFLS